MGDRWVGRGNLSPQFDDRRFLHWGNGKAIECFEHRQPIYRRQLTEQQIAGPHPLRCAALGNCVLFPRHDIAQDHSSSGIAGQYFEERKRGVRRDSR
jgi:hypothetical protein